MFEVERLGDLSLGGVGFELPEAPKADVYMVKFSCPGDARVRTVFARVLDATPLPGAEAQKVPHFVHLRFQNLDFADERAIARSLDQAALGTTQRSVFEMAADAHYHDDFEIEIAWTRPPSPAALEVVPVADDGLEPDPSHITMSSLPDRLQAGTGGLGDYLFSYLTYEYRRSAS